MKKGLLYSIVALAAIVIVAGFSMQLGTIPELDIPESMAGNILFVCPAADTMWDSIAMGLHPFIRYIVGAFFFAVVLLLFGWGWQLYQNLISDKFKRDSFKTIWGFTKFAFWAGIIVLLLTATPNSFKRVEITGADGEWVLCDSSSPNMRAVQASAVHAR